MKQFLRLLTATSAMIALHSGTAYAAEAETPMATPTMTWPLKNNPKPLNVDTGALGKVYVTGAVSGLAYAQDNATSADKDSRVDFTNASVFVQNTSGPLQFFAQVGGYSIPALGTSYVRGDVATDLYGFVPQAYVKYAPNDNFSIQAGKLATLIGAEYTFTFQNQNITRGLLWNQENAINRGVQLNYTAGPVAASVSLNDGFYSEKYSWLSGLVSYTFNPNDVLTLVASGNMDESARSTFETPLVQNNSQIYNAMYMHKTGPWTIAPYLQYSYVPKNSDVGITDASSTMGGAMLVDYAVTDQVHLPVRAEYINSTGTGGTNLLYGAGSDAWSFTITPTYQKGIFFARAEGSYVETNDSAAGSAFGKSGNDTSQGRLMIETGVLF